MEQWPVRYTFGMKIFLWVVGVLAILVLAFYALNAYIYNEKQAPEDQVTLPFGN